MEGAQAAPGSGLMRNLDLFDFHPVPIAPFDGPAYIPEFDVSRLTKQIRRVYDCMRDGQWRSLNEIAELTGDPAPSVSAQLRHLRKEKFGAHTVEKRRVGQNSQGFYQYQLQVREKKQ